MIAKYKLTSCLILLYTIGAFIGPNFWSIDIGIMHLSLNRILLLPMFILVAIQFVANMAKNHLICYVDNKHWLYSISFFVFWVLYSLLSFLWAADYYAWAKNFYFLFSGVIVIAFYSCFVNSTYDIDRILLIATIMSVLHGLIGCYEIYSGVYFFPVNNVKIHQMYRIPASSWFNVNSFGLVMLIGYYCARCIYLLSPKNILKIFSLFATIFLLVMCFVSGSRGVIYGLILSEIASAIFCRYIRKKILVGGAALLIILIGMYPILRASGVILFDISSVFTFSFGQDGSSDSLRVNLIKNGVFFLINHQLMGVGLGNIQYYMSTMPMFDTHGLVDIHNWWFEILVTSGIFVFTGYVVFYCVTLRDMIRAANDQYLPRYYNCISYSVMSFMLAFVIASVSESSLMGHDVVWVIFAIIIAFHKLLSSENLCIKH